MPNTLKGAVRAESKKSRVIKSLQHEADTLEKLIETHGDLPIGTPPVAPAPAQSVDIKRVQNEIEFAYAVVEEQFDADGAILDVAHVLCALERAPAHHDTHPSHNVLTGGGYAHGFRAGNDSLPILLRHARHLVEMALNDVDCMREQAIDALGEVTK